MWGGNGSTYGGVPKSYAEWNEEGKGKESRRNKNVAYNRSEFVSYQTVVAKYHDGPLGKFCLTSSYKWSQSTSAHLRAVQLATRQFFEVPNIITLDESDHTKNCEYLWGAVTDTRTKMINCWKNYYHVFDGSEVPADAKYNDGHTYRYAYIVNQYKKLLNYLHCTGFKWRELPPINKLVADIEWGVKQKFAEYHSPRQIARRATYQRAKARKYALRTLGHDTGR